MYTNEELKNILLDAIASHQSLDNKLHLMEAVTKVFDEIESDNENDLAAALKGHNLDNPY